MLREKLSGGKFRDLFYSKDYRSSVFKKEYKCPLRTEVLTGAFLLVTNTISRWNMFRFLVKNLVSVTYDYSLPHNVPETVIISDFSSNKQ